VMIKKAQNSSPVYISVNQGDDQVTALDDSIRQMYTAVPLNLKSKITGTGALAEIDSKMSDSTLSQQTLTGMDAVKHMPAPPMYTTEFELYEHGDFHAIRQPEELKVVDLSSFYTAAGFRPKYSLKNSINEVDFCSGVFLPVVNEEEDEEKWVYGLKPFRAACKLGWCTDFPREPEKCMQWLTEVTAGATVCLSHVPVARLYVQRMRQLCAEPLETLKRSNIKVPFTHYDPDFKYKLAPTKIWDLDEERGAIWFAERYGLNMELTEKLLWEQISAAEWGDVISSPVNVHGLSIDL